MACGDAEGLDFEAVEVQTPRLVVEILSDSTEAKDCGSKFTDYQTVGAIDEYLLVDSRHRTVERFRRTQQGLWLYQRYAPDQDVTLESIGLTCSVATFYRVPRRSFADVFVLVQVVPPPASLAQISQALGHCAAREFGERLKRSRTGAGVCWDVGAIG